MKKVNFKKILYIIAVVVMVGLVNMPVVFAKKEGEPFLEYLHCGDRLIPAPIAPVVRVAVLMLQIILPLVIIIVGNIDFLKAVIASDQEKIKKNQHQFMNRLKAGLIFFFVITAFKFIVSIVNTSATSDDFISCVDCLVSDEDACGDVEKTNPFVDID